MTNEAILETLKVQPLTEEEKQSRHILKRLTGPIASCKEETRNGRKYNKALWEQALNDDIFKEKVATKSLFLELGHPDREETDITCACAVIPEMPKIVGDDLFAVVDVLDTPNGRLLNTLIDYGFVPGISSRGSGDVIGDEVDPESFFLETWDIVQTPALKKARLSVTEGLDKTNLKLKKALCESLNSADEEDKKIMTEALQNLNIDVSETDTTKTEYTSLNENVDTSILTQTDEKSNETINDGTENIIKSLQESLKSNVELETKVKSLQEELAVRDAKVSKLEEDINRSNSTIVRLTELVKGSKDKTRKIEELEKELKNKSQIVEKLLKRSSIKESLDSKVKPLKEEIAKKNELINSKTEEIKSLNEQLSTLEKDTKTLKENLATEKKTYLNNLKSLNESLNEKSKLIEKYDRLTESMANRYISIRAKQLGVRPEEITNKLGERYSLKDVDTICEDLRTYKINVSKLPFVLDNNSVIKVNESKTIGSSKVVLDDDYIDEDTLKIVEKL